MTTPGWKPSIFIPPGLRHRDKATYALCDEEGSVTAGTSAVIRTTHWPFSNVALSRTPTASSDCPWLLWIVSALQRSTFSFSLGGAARRV